GGLKAEEDDQGNLVVTVTEEQRKEIAEYIKDNVRRLSFIEADVLEPLTANGLSFFTVDEFGALSEMPVLADLVYLPEDEGKANIQQARGEPFAFQDWIYETDWEESTLWLYPNYQIRSFLDDLIETGTTKFINTKNM